MDIFEGITFEGVPDGMGEGQSRQNRRHLQGSEPRALAGRRARSLIRLRCHVLVARWEGRKKKKAGSGKKCLQHKSFMAYPLTI